MKKTLLPVFSALALAAQAYGGVAVGSAAPDFSLKNQAGKTVHLSDFKGKLVVLEWVNPDCPFVHKHYDSGNMQGLQKKYTAKGVEWLTIDSSAEGSEGYLGGPKDAKAFIKERHAAMSDLLLDHAGAVGMAYGAKTTPTMFVIRRDGRVAYEGAIDDKASTDVADVPTAKNYVAVALDEIEAGKPVTVTQTRSYGCSIKYK